MIIPAFNESENIGECLKSLQAQTRPADEIIVVDNESEDETAEIACTYGVKVLSYPRPDVRHGNIGLVRQKGAEEAEGDLIVSTDADCVYPADWLRKIEDHFNSNPKLALLGGPVLASNRDPLNDFMMGVGSFGRSYVAGWGIPYFLAANTSFRKDAFLLTEGYKGAGGHGPIEEWVVSFRLSRVGEWLWDDDLICFTRVPESWRAYTVALPLSMAPLAAWGGAAALKGVL
ncbi:MAG: glycosyltransferase [Candidatus Gracilibacteria bacterium]|nr:glycosyltransferase [Candidatus Gracilibacteria bacterium]